MTPDELAPMTGVGVGAERIAVALADATIKPAAGAIARFTVDYELCDDAGAVRLPLEVMVVGPSRILLRRTHVLVAPSTIAVRIEEGGPHRVTVRELAHNLWWGGLSFDATGDPVDAAV